MRKKSILTERWKVSKLKEKGLTKRIGTQGKEIKVGTTTETTTTNLGIEIYIEIVIGIGRERMTRRIVVAFMFCQGTMMRVLEV